MVPMTLEIFLPCYFGNELSFASSKLSTALFHSAWIDESKEMKKMCGIFMENTKKEWKITAFSIFDLNLETFTAIGNLAYSLFAILKKINA
jgi:odorant receptor